MSAHVVIGGGVAGLHHVRVLGALGRTAQLLDVTQPDFDRSRCAALEAADHDTIWHICTPTRTHLDEVRKLIAAAPQPRIILEKPIGRPGESMSFRACTEKADIVVQNQYSYAHIVKTLVQMAGEAARAGPLRIDIFFQKKRAGDGRFLDTDRQALGYEGFHQLAIGLRLVEELRGVEAARAFAVSARLSLRGCDADCFDLGLDADGIQMRLSSILDRHPRSARVGLTDRSGQRVTLHFETNRWLTDQPRQLHAIRAADDEFLFEEDLMHTGVLACLSALQSRDLIAIGRNQTRALEIEALLDKAYEAAVASIRHA